METHQHDECRVPDIEEYIKISMWNEEMEIGKGYGGITALIKEIWCDIIKVEKEDPNKQFIWLKITDMEDTIWVVACNFAPKR